MTEQQLFTAMLTRAGVGHGLRHDFEPEGTAVQVESEDSMETVMVTEFWFDANGQLKTVHVAEMDMG